jgi:UDP-N-acetylmuramate: L-alanyl-gamma-D-glutamyl-meso-diaminopimelate ligase
MGPYQRFPYFRNLPGTVSYFHWKIEPGGILIYNASDPVLSKLVEESSSTIRKMPYTLPPYTINDGVTQVTFEGSTGSLAIFGNHNLLNLHAAFLVCLELGISADNFLRRSVTLRVPQSAWSWWRAMIL